MSRSDLSDQPNPFAFAAIEGFQTASSSGKNSPSGKSHTESIRSRSSGSKSAVIKAAKYLLMIALVFAGLIAVRHVSGKWLLNQLTHDFDNLSAADQQKRLAQIEGFGPAAIPALVSAMAAQQTTTGRTAYDILRRFQNQWTVLSEKASTKRHSELVAAIASVAPRLPDDRTGWATALVQQSIMESVGQKTSEEKYLYRNANDALAILAHDHRSGPSILGSQDFAADSTDQSPRRLVAKARPLPVEKTDAGGQWTDWPPGSGNNIARSDTPSIYRSGSSKLNSSKLNSSNSGNQTSVRLRPVVPNQPIELKPIEKINNTASTGSAFDQPVKQAQSVETLVETALEVYDDRSVMHWLSSDDAQQRDAARLELLSRGFNDSQIDFSINLAHPDASVRLHFVNELSRHQDIDPRPWLKLMWGDESREVRLAVISVLGSLRGHDATSELRQLMSQERDPMVAAKIRDTLELGKQVRR
ncbi:hypothetical protein LF1_08760 [Rubripirellula obstinata]|uniref:HEAT repeat protein n=1 Tax=Rubripirellula obstinata TaxID=406547 RepID=A0A5B1CB26_9BACT|nr:HEAT repeat domain-containing protein [Rubripirellula obstinata]KAA1258358.1 hypothetical protein LF1_08760 [Rubripirellula obstinata]